MFEDKLLKKYQAQRWAKELMREKNKLKKERIKKESLDDEMSIAALLKEMRADIKDIKNDNREIKTNMQEMNAKIVSIEKKQNDSEQKTANELHEIRYEVRGNKEKLEESITANVIRQIDPII